MLFNAADTVKRTWNWNTWMAVMGSKVTCGSGKKKMLVTNSQTSRINIVLFYVKLNMKYFKKKVTNYMFT